MQTRRSVSAVECVAIESASFRAIVEPGDTITYEVTAGKPEPRDNTSARAAPEVCFHGRIRTDRLGPSKTVASARLRCRVRRGDGGRRSNAGAAADHAEVAAGAGAAVFGAKMGSQGRSRDDGKSADNAAMAIEYNAWMNDFLPGWVDDDGGGGGGGDGVGGGGGDGGGGGGGDGNDGK